MFVNSSGLFARYPNFLQYSIFGTSISFIVYFVASARYRDSQLRKTLTKDEYLMYHLKKKAVLTQRCSFVKIIFGEFGGIGIILGCEATEAKFNCCCCCNNCCCAAAIGFIN
ncbi:hypothetical protein Mgra_00000417, partial [Meloidogyne graminicola]